MKKILLSVFAACIILLSFTPISFAAAKYAPQTIPILHYNQTNLKITFANVKKATNISYDLVYEANGIPQGVGGTLTPQGKSVISKTITLGTCSSGTCVNHKKLKKMKLYITFEFPGKTITKTYTVKTK